MKKLIFMLCMIIMGLDALAEGDYKQGFDTESGSFSFNYLGRFKKAATINYDMRIRMVNVGGGYNVSGPDGWHVYAGLGAQYNLTPNVYLEGAVGPIYAHSKYEWYDKSEKKTKSEGSGAFGGYLCPRIAFVTNKGWGIHIGYMMTAPKMKFDGFFDNGSVMLGLVF